MQRGLESHSQLQTSVQPLADGGEGSAHILTKQCGGQMLQEQVQDPLGRSVLAQYGWVQDSQLALIEMAAASGLSLLHPSEHDVMKASTYGTGQLIRAAVKRGAKTIFLCLGGSATSDMGIGMAAACGYAFWDEFKILLDPVAASLSKIRSITYEDFAIDWNHLETLVLCDVSNMLLGREGAVSCFAPQKGANASQMELLEKGFQNMTSVLAECTQIDASTMPGAGAAGGLGAAAVWFLNAQLASGADFLLDAVQFDHQLSNCDWVITGEGKIDKQSLNGKLSKAVLDRAKRMDKKVMGVFAQSEFAQEELREIGFDHSLILSQKDAHLRLPKVSIWDIEKQVSGVTNLLALS